MWNFVKEIIAAFRSMMRDCSQEHYNEGYDAFLAGSSEDDNPYAGGSIAGADWDYGWAAAADDCYKSNRQFDEI